MTQTTAVLHAGLLARKGEARPASISNLDTMAPAESGPPTIIDIDQAMRRQPVGERPGHSTQPSRVIELPRPKSVRPSDQIVKNRKQIHARVSPEIHVLLKTLRGSIGLNRISSLLRLRHICRLLATMCWHSDATDATSGTRDIRARPLPWRSGPERPPSNVPARAISHQIMTSGL